MPQLQKSRVLKSKDVTKPDKICIHRMRISCAKSVIFGFGICHISGRSRNLEWGKRTFPPLISPSLSSFPLEVGPLNPARVPGEHCKLPRWRRGLGRKPSRNRIWCILALKSDIWWLQYNFHNSP